ncbi:uncharacterized protein LOC111375125 isoform X2 [Olea europaea var. sylvestris]|uniref:Tify domain-containing protein n=1 Tax=Olea europaea subsp. europaea TaxID=158383 RepID=A0A8S0TCY9_OLEEU|nr:uncharacterized protein LOC111375125 isoform X2 [Olea europaea var. sylvestris]CAA3002875.1 Hypothetical predicted protein [Olea europaea subsp. europaea]
MNKSIWISRDHGSLANGEMDYDTSARIEQKRAHQWSMDSSEQELFSNKKQAVEPASNSPTLGAENMSMSLFGNSPSTQSDQISDCLFGTKLVRSSSFADKNASVFVPGDLNMGKKGFVDQLENNSSICLSMFRDVEVPLCLNTGVRKVKVNQVVSENQLSEFVGESFNPGDKNKITSPTFHRTGNGVSLAPAYNTGDRSTIMEPVFCKTNENSISVEQASNKRDGNFMLMGHHYDNLLSIGQAFDKRNYNFISIGEQCEKENGNLMSIGPNYFKGNENFIAMDAFYNKANEDFLSAGPTCDKGVIDITSMTSLHGQQDATVASLGNIYNYGNSSILTTGQTHNNGKGTTISFGVFQDNPDESDPSGRSISNHDGLLNQFSAQPSEELGQKGSLNFPSTTIVSASTSRTGSSPKNKEQKTTKKVPSNNFPSNVKSLLSTGILDGVPVKYVSWSREKNLQGVVNGTGYLCACKECKFSNEVNAYEFERHAGCKTKHPNNHIYFENGKTIYAVVQELKSTPQDKLFETIEKVTGSSVNQKNFRTWKASYQAATRELQRIYGKDEVAVPS